MSRARAGLSRASRLAAFGVAVAFIQSCQDATGPKEAGITIVSGGSGSDTIDVELHPLVVEVRGPGGRVARGVEIIFHSTRFDSNTNKPSTIFIASTDRDVFYNTTTVFDSTDRSGRASVRVRTGSYAVGDGNVSISVPTLGLQATAHYTTLAGKPTRLVLTPKDTPVVVGGSYQLHAQLVDRSSNPLAGTATFSSSSSNVQLSETGQLSGTTVGRARVLAQLGSFSDSAFASVVPDATIAVRDMGIFVGDSMMFAQARLDGANYRPISFFGLTPTEFSPSNNPAPQWRATSKQIVYSKTVAGLPRLFVGDSTRAERRLISQVYAGRGETDPEVSSDGAWVYFVASLADGSQSIWRVPSTGGTPEQITTTAEGWDFRSPTLSPDGSELAYIVSPASWSNDYNLYVRTLATGAVRRLATTGVAGPRWSPAGEWIMYTTGVPYSGFGGALRLVHPDGTDDRVLSSGGYFPGGTWSPDGKYVLAMFAYPMVMELIDVADGTRLPLVYKKGWYGPAWRR